MALSPEFNPADIEFELPPTMVEYAYENPHFSLASWFLNDPVLEAQREACDRMLEKYPQLNSDKFRVRLFEHFNKTTKVPMTPEDMVKGFIIGGLLIHKPRDKGNIKPLIP